ncbi:MAG TPA: imidazole glycerol phosphate synthase subunit HisH [Thermoplasmata archaeon]|jgi:glutamine amidotransferase
MRVTIIDYGVGNLHSIAKGIERAGGEVEVVSDARRLLDAECMVFPGVGAFGAAMEALTPVLPRLRSSIREGTPALGVCLGMQILFERSEESPGSGVAVLQGEVRKLKADRIPQMGWNEVAFEDDPLFDGIPRNSLFYFANSYVCHPIDDVAVATTEYGESFPSAVRKDKLCGVQFHPEKSGPPGLRLLRNFLRVAEGSS